MGRILNMRASGERERSAAAHILVAALAHVPSAWKDLPSAREEVDSFVHDPDRIALLGMEDDEVRGWIGAIRHTAFGWELHPLVVDPQYQRTGWGRRLVSALEELARGEGAITLWLGTDDDFGGTNLYGQHLYPNVLEKLQGLSATAGHPFTFYQRLGYVVTGVFPDVDGRGKHDLLMAKHLA